MGLLTLKSLCLIINGRESFDLKAEMFHKCQQTHLTSLNNLIAMLLTEE